MAYPDNRAFAECIGDFHRIKVQPLRNSPVTPLTMYFFVLLALPLLVIPLCLSEDVPLQMAKKPLMDPIPLLPELTHKVFMDIEIDGDALGSGRIVLGLFGKAAPKAVENFRALCACDLGRKGEISEKSLCYRGSSFHRVIPNFMLQGGDFTHGDGTGGESIYGGSFDDEKGGLDIKLNRKFLLAMANSGRNTNRSQFFITTVKAQWLSGKHVVFGVVLAGYSVLKAIESHGTNGGRTTTTITIQDSGELRLTEEDKEPIPVQIRPNKWESTAD